MRSKYGTYWQYHTSADNMDFISPSGLGGGFLALKESIKVIENNITPLVNITCEPQLGRRGLYPTISTGVAPTNSQLLLDILNYCDGTLSLLDIAELLGKSFSEIHNCSMTLLERGLLVPLQDQDAIICKSSNQTLRIFR
jgi:aminopeptidase-like protein